MVVGVLIEIENKAVDKIFDYQVPEKLEGKIKKGLRVKVPFGNRTLEGFIIEVKNETSYQKDLKELISIVDEEFVLTDEMLGLGKWLQQETLASLISCYQAMLPKALKAKNGSVVSKKYKTIYTYLGIKNQKITEKQQEILSFFEKKKEVTREEMSTISKARLDVLVKHGILKEEKKEWYRLSYQNEGKKKYPLTEDQEKVVKEVKESMDRIFLLHGVTGSGKTEVYMELIEDALKEGKQSIVLVPEISLTPQMISRFEQRFGSRIAALHSSLSEGEKYDEWRRIEKGEVDIVIGARSAVFAPLKKIGLIIIDEEHSPTYKQDVNPRYHTRDVAIKRALYHDGKVILGSATPTLESYARARKKVYHLLELPNRVNGRSLPKVVLIDMNKEIKYAIGHFSRPLIAAIKETLEKKEQIILFLNRRGYSSVISCKNCGYALKCPNCDITLTYHKANNTLRCHYCGYGSNVIKQCPECHEMALQDLGVGTEKIEEELSHLFKDAKIIRMDVDTTSKKGSHKKMIESFANHEADILLGTQIVAKGLDFENVTLVGVLNCDTALMIPDFRSSENTFDLLSQVAGRCGRSKKEGKVYFQTYNKDHYAIVCAKNNTYHTFFQEEMKIRRMMKYPPYYYLVLIKIASKKQESALLEAKRCEKVLKKYLDQTILLGPSPAMLFKKQNIYRYQLILKYQYQNNLQEVLERLDQYYKTNKEVKLEIDFNPIHM